MNVLIAAPSGPPSSVRATDFTSNTITFEWSKPLCGERHGEITSYSYSLFNVLREVVSHDTTTSTMTSIENLSPFTNYSFTVAARNGDLIGTFSNELMKATAEAGRYF